MINRILGGLAAVAMAGAIALGSETPAHAVPYTEYSIDNSNACCGSGPYGTVTVYQLGGGTLEYDVALTGNWYFIGSGPAFTFDLSNVTSVTYSNVTTGWTPQSGTQSPGSIQMDGRGNFEFGVTPPYNGGSGNNGQTLSFDVTATDTTTHQGITLANILAAAAVGKNPANYFGIDFGTCSTSKDVFACTATGFAGAAGILGSGNQNPPSAAPVPASFWLLGSVLAVFGLLLAGVRRRSRFVPA